MGFGSAIDTPCAIRGRVIDIHLLEERIDRSPSGWRTASGSEQLSRIATVPSGFMLAPDDDAQNTATAIISTGVVVDLDIDVVPEVVAPFVAGAIDIIGDTVWVMHRSDPTLLRIDRSVVPPRTTSYLLPLTIESATSMWTRRIHATEAGCWIVGEHDIHWLDGSDADTDAVSIVRVCNDGGRTTALLDGSLYVLAGSTEHLTIDRRHGLTRIPPVPHTVRRLDVRTRALVSVGDDAIRSAANAAVRHPFTATALDGTTWVVDGDIVVRTGIEREADDVYYHDVEHPIIGAVRWVHTSPADDPDTVRMMDSITIRIEPE